MEKSRNHKRNQKNVLSTPVSLGHSEASMKSRLSRLSSQLSGLSSQSSGFSSQSSGFSSRLSGLSKRLFRAHSFSRRTASIVFSVFAVAFVVSFLAFSIFAPVNSSDAATVTTNLSAGGYYINITSNDVVLDVTTTVSGATSFTKDTITTKTNSPSGYKLYVSMENDKDCNKTTGVCDGTGTGENIVPGNALYQDGDSASGNFISPTTGTFSAPDTLALNSWGVSTTAITTGNESTFWKMPLLSSPQLIQSTSSANTTGVTKDLYFGAKANFSLPSGSYSNTIVYTAAGNSNATGNNEIAVSPTSQVGTSGGGTATIITSLYTNYQLSSSDVSVTIGGNACPVTSVYTNSSSNTVAIKCTIPAASSMGAKDVVVSIAPFDWQATLTGGYTYVGFWTITYMQDMTPQICATATTPSASAGTSMSTIDTTGAHQGSSAYVPQRTLYDYRGIDGTGTRSNPASGSNAVSYTVRKLADGNCWMSENLKLTLSTSHSYEVSTNSGGTTSWTPTSCSTSGSCAMNGNTVCTGSGSSRKCWYSWYAATAGSGTESQSSGDASSSICPKGWRLPADYSISPTKSFGSLTYHYLGYAENKNNVSDYTKLEALPLNFVRPGWYNSSGLNRPDEYGHSWSSTAHDSTHSHNLFLSTTSIQPQGYSGKFNGLPIRCVAI